MIFLPLTRITLLDRYGDGVTSVEAWCGYIHDQEKEGAESRVNGEFDALVMSSHKERQNDDKH